MKKTLLIVCLLFASTFIAAKPLNGVQIDSNETLLKEVSKGFSRVAKKAIPAVVYIETQVGSEPIITDKNSKGPHDNPFDYFQDEFFNRFFSLPNERKKKSEVIRGSGFFVSSEGHILTNYHVVDHGSKIQVTLHDGRKVQATITGSDPKTDLAVIKIEDNNLPFLSFGSSDKLDVGDWVIAVGNPFGLQASVTVGVVSAKGRNQLHITDFEDFIQTDAAINPGNSGGPLLNIEGEVIGINTAIVSGSGGYMGIGFAIPSTMASMIVEQLIKEGSVTRGFLGVTLQPVDSELAKYYKLEEVHGALISEVLKDSPADQAGLKQEDIILAYNNTPVESLSSFRNAVSLMAPGSRLHLKILRDGKTHEVRATISSVPKENLPVALATGNKLGIQVQNLSAEIAGKLQYSQNQGVVVTQVRPGSPADIAGIHSGSLILAINRQKISSVAEFHTLMQQAEGEGHLLLMVRQGEAIRFIALQVD